MKDQSTVCPMCKKHKPIKIYDLENWKKACKDCLTKLNHNKVRR